MQSLFGSHSLLLDFFWSMTSTGGEFTKGRAIGEEDEVVKLGIRDKDSSYSNLVGDLFSNVGNSISSLCVWTQLMFIKCLIHFHFILRISPWGKKYSNPCCKKGKWDSKRFNQCVWVSLFQGNMSRIPLVMLFPPSLLLLHHNCVATEHSPGSVKERCPFQLGFLWGREETQSHVLFPRRRIFLPLQRRFKRTLLLRWYCCQRICRHTVARVIRVKQWGWTYQERLHRSSVEYWRCCSYNCKPLVSNLMSSTHCPQATRQGSALKDCQLV